MKEKKGHLYWLRRKLPDQKVIDKMENLLKDLNLHTVCDSALCPNRGECFKNGTATFMIMGDVCTRNCQFCAVKKGKPVPLDPREPIHIAQAAKYLKLKHVVVTSVTRDDLFDGGAEHFAQTVIAIRKLLPRSTVEILIPDFQGSREALQKVIEVRPEVINHNIETIERLYSSVRPIADYKTSLQLINRVKIDNEDIITKSGIMLGLGEEKEEVVKAMKDLRKVNCDLLTIGQYLRPSPQHLKVKEYIHPDEFEVYRKIGMSLGFKHVLSGPLVRSSYRAGVILQNILTQKSKAITL
ncbi:MAG: lipoyl synthase [Candidatus Caldatribacteriota bacterium]|nr:lipoyl synthase [Candidatus Caldatribacteriota bacterium]